jgi:hypothetical protein
VGAAVTTAVGAAVTTAVGAAVTAAAGAVTTAAGAGGETTSSNVYFRHRCSLTNNRPATVAIIPILEDISSDIGYALSGIAVWPGRGAQRCKRHSDGLPTDRGMRHSWAPMAEANRLHESRKSGHER